jgi:hypothetical protein
VCVFEREGGGGSVKFSPSTAHTQLHVLYLGLLRYGLGVELFCTRTECRKLFTTLVQSGVGNRSCML